MTLFICSGIQFKLARSDPPTRLYRWTSMYCHRYYFSVWQGRLPASWILSLWTFVHLPYPVVNWLENYTSHVYQVVRLIPPARRLYWPYASKWSSRTASVTWPCPWKLCKVTFLTWLWDVRNTSVYGIIPARSGRHVVCPVPDAHTPYRQHSIWKCSPIEWSGKD